MTSKKDNFIFILEALKSQNDYDREYSRNLSKTISAESVPMYNNGILVNTLVAEICAYFEDMQEARLEVNNFMYELDFGRCKGASVITPEDLWDRLGGEDDYDNPTMSVSMRMIDFSSDVTGAFPILDDNKTFGNETKQ